jgi:hypothetical protein
MTRSLVTSSSFTTPQSRATPQNLVKKSRSSTTPSGYTWSTHTAFARDKYTLSEMGFRGYERRDILDYKHKLYAVVHFDSSAAQVQASLDFDDACQGLEYGYQEYVGLMLEAIDRDVFAGSWGDAVVCSVHTTLVAMAQGLFPDRWASLVYPALWAYWTGAKH